MESLSRRPVYSQEQLSKYVSFLQKRCRKFTLPELEAEIKVDPLAALGRLQRRQMASVPFGSLILHYSQHHTISLDEAALFTKIVDRRMGGYCMENNTFFATILRSLGYKVLTTGARISKAVQSGGKEVMGFVGWSHMVLLVIIDNRKYMVDVGMGTQGACRPIEVKDGQIIQNVPSAEGRLVYQNVAPFTDQNQRLWIFQTRIDKESPWMATFCFSELEFIPEDFEVMNFKTSSSRASWFTYRLVLNHVILDQETDEPIGAMTLVGGEVKRRLHGTSEVVEVCNNETERVRALKQWFDIDLREEEIRGIRGMASDLGK